MASVPSPAAAKSVHYADEAAYTDYVNDPSKQSPHSGISAGIRHRIYKRRWFMLFLSFLLNLANSAIWIAVPTAQDPLAKQYNVSTHSIVFLTNIVYILFLPGSMLGFYLLSRNGVMLSTTAGGVLLALSCWVRVAASYLGLFWLEIVASVIFAFGQPLVMDGVSTFNVNWMAEHERFFSTMVYNTVPSSLGGAVLGLVVQGQVTEPDQLPAYFVTIASTITFIALMYAIFMRERPPTAPVRKKSRSLSMKAGLKESDMTVRWMLGQRTFLIYLYNSIVQIGMLCCCMAIIPNYMGALHYSSGDTNVLLSMFLFSGIAGVVFIAPATDKLQVHWVNAPKHLLILLAGVGIMGAFSLLANSEPDNFDAIAISMCIISISITAGIPIALEEAAAMNPQKSAFSASVMIASANVFGFMAVYVVESLGQSGTYSHSCYFFLALLSIQLVANFFIEPRVDLDEGGVRYGAEEEAGYTTSFFGESVGSGGYTNYNSSAGGQPGDQTGGQRGSRSGSSFSDGAIASFYN
jgi:MFS family permease